MISIALVFTYICSLLIALLYLYLHHNEQDRALKIWSWSWLLFSFRFAIQLGLFHDLLPPGLIILQQMISIFSGLLFLRGTEIFFNKTHSRAWEIAGGAAAIWAIFSYFGSLSFIATNLPVDLLIGLCFFFSGLYFIRNSIGHTRINIFTGSTLILWGIHKIDYSFLRPLEWFAPWGFMIATLLFLVSAGGIVLIHYQKSRLAMDGEIKKRKISEQRFRSIVETTTSGIILADEEGTIAFANKGVEEMFCYGPGELIGKPLLNLMPERYRAGHLQGLDQLKGEKESNYFGKSLSFYGLTSDKREFPLDLNVSHWLDNGKIFFSSILTDTSSIRGAEQQLKQSNALLASLIDSIPDLIFYKDHQGTYLGCNRAFVRFTGQADASAIIGKTDFDLFPKHEAEFFRTMDQQMLASGHSRQNEEWVTYPDDTKILLDTLKTLFYDPDGTVLGLIGISRDITERQSQLNSIKESQQLLQNVFHSIQDGISILSPDLTIIDVNPVMKDLYPHQLPLQGKKCHSAYHNNDQPCLNCPTIRARKNKRLEFGEVDLVSADGTIGTLELYAYPMLDEQGELTGVVEYVRNITDKKKKEKQTLQLEDQLRQAQKMEAIGTLAGGIAHDFNNILVPILGFTELLLRKEEPDSPRRQDLQEILYAAQRAKELVKQILTFSRQTSQGRAPLMATPVVKECIKLLRASIPTSIAIKSTMPTEELMILADPTHLHQIVMNLGTNAYQAMQGQGVLTITLGETTISRKDLLQKTLHLTPGEYICLEVSDTGSGIDPAILSNIFHPYFTTKEQGQGTGLGLSVVHGIIKSYGGEITVTSTLGTGSQFTVYLPLHKHAHSPELKTVQAEIPQGNQESILLVDDEGALLRSVQRILEDLGYQVLSRLDSQDALETFLANPDRFDLVITDQSMPGMTGDQLAVKLLAARPDLPIIMCTGFSNAIDKESAQELGIRAFMLKPFSKNELASTIHNVLADPGKKQPEKAMST